MLCFVMCTQQGDSFMKFILAGILLFSGSTFAGVMNGGGGKGVICRDSQSKVTSVELLDLWEARVIYGKIPKQPGLSVQDQTKRLIANLKNSIYSVGFSYSSSYANNHGGNNSVSLNGAEAVEAALTDGISIFLSPNNPKVHWLIGANIKLTDDSYEVVTPSDCSIEQVAKYIDTNNGGMVLVNKDLADKMDNVNKAALYVHEAYYAFIRKFGTEYSSIRVRRAIGFAMSDYQFINPETYLTEKGSFVYCQSPLAEAAHSEFIIYQTSDKSGYSIFPLAVIGRYNIGYRSSKIYKLNSIYELFQNKSDLSTLGDVGFDYNYFARFYRNEAGEFAIELKFTSSPDDENGQVPVYLKCTL